MSPERWWLGERYHHPLTKKRKRTRWLRLREGSNEEEARANESSPTAASSVTMMARVSDEAQMDNATLRGGGRGRDVEGRRDHSEVIILVEVDGK